MEPLPGSSGRGTRLTLVALALLALLALVAFASRSGFGGASDARPSPAYVSWAFSVFLVLFVLAIPVTLYAFYLQGQERASERARGFRRIVLQNVALLLLFIGAVAFFVYLRHQRGGFLRHPLQASKGLAGKGGKGAQGGYEPVFEWPVLVVAVPLVLAGLVAALVAYRHHKARLRGGKVPRDATDLVDELQLELGDAIDDLEAEPDPRRAVIAAYARMEGVLGRHGLQRRPSEAPYEYLARVLLELRVPADAVRRLTDAFERAKFSRHEIDEARRRDAIGALVAVRDGLREVAA
jgi:hypothetical protein